MASIAVGAALLAITANAYAVQVTGTIQIDGDVTFNTTDLLTATQATFPGAPDGSVTSGTLAYSAAGVQGSAVNFSNFNFAATGPQVVSPLWTFTNLTNNWTYTFNLATITDIIRSTLGNGSDVLTIGGMGTVNITGAGSPYELTNANWSFNVTDSSGGQNGTFLFAFNDSNTATSRIPDGGMTVLLLGAALSLLGVLRRKLGT
jgi:hypothetical protein